MKQLHTIAVTALLAAGPLTAWADTAILVEDPNGTVTSLPLTTASKVTFPVEGLTVTGAEGKVIPYAQVAKIRFKTESGIPGIMAPQNTLAIRENPVGDTLRLTGTLDAPADVTITSVSGQTAMRLAKWNGADIDVSALHPGIYLITVNNQTLKFIKK